VQHPATNTAHRDPEELVTVQVVGEFQLAAPITKQTRVAEVGERIQVPHYLACDLLARRLAQFA